MAKPDHPHPEAQVIKSLEAPPESVPIVVRSDTSRRTRSMISLPSVAPRPSFSWWHQSRDLPETFKCPRKSKKLELDFVKTMRECVKRQREHEAAEERRLKKLAVVEERQRKADALERAKVEKAAKKVQRDLERAAKKEEEKRQREEARLEREHQAQERKALQAAEREERARQKREGREARARKKAREQEKARQKKLREERRRHHQHGGFNYGRYR